MTSSPHDLLFRGVFSDPREASLLLQGLLPPSLSAGLDLPSMRHIPGSFAGEDFAWLHSDLLFDVPLATGRGSSLLYLLLEHQSTPDPRMPSRLLGYLVRVWEHHSKVEKTAALPPVLPVVVYHGAREWSAPRHMHEQLTVTRSELGELEAYVPGFTYVLRDLSAVPDSELRAHVVGGAALWLLKHAHEGRLWERLPEWLDLLAEIQSRSGLAALELLMRYTLEVEEMPPPREAMEMLERRLGPGSKKMVMSAADKLREEGHVQGRQEGHVQGREEGRAQGREQGRHEGKTEAARRLVRRLLARRFGTLPPSATMRIETAGMERLELCAERLLDAATLEEALAVLD